MIVFFCLYFNVTLAELWLLLSYFLLSKERKMSRMLCRRALGCSHGATPYIRSSLEV
jgi:hypothetical protein